MVTLYISDPFVMISFQIPRRVCVAILRHNAETESSCWRERATPQLTTVMHAISASLLCKID